MWALIEAPIPNAPEAKYISQRPSPNNLLQIASALAKKRKKSKLYDFLTVRTPPIIRAKNIVYNMGEITCTDDLYNYCNQYLGVLRLWNPTSDIWLSGMYAWLHRNRFKGFKVTSNLYFENSVTGIDKRSELPNKWDLVDWKAMPRFKGRGVRVTLRATRGCPYRCKMCPVQLVYKGKCHRLSVDWVLKEIGTLYYDYGIREIGFLDDNLFANKSWGKKLLTKITSSNLRKCRFTFEEGLDVYTALDEKIVALLKKAGFYHIKLGVESLNPKTLRYIDKGYKDPKLAIKAIKLLQKYKLNPTCFMCIGFPTDTVESIRKTIDTFVDLGVKLRTQILWQYPGLDFVGKGVDPRKLKILKKEAMDRTGSTSWKKK